ncbi:hypothetical protein E2542_SST30892 [Spatholobus suberectus]|nr:hypothetical protein E2542_SST30892 [Spatholobus suberectus]
MGNSIRNALGNPRFPCFIELGRSAAIELSTKIRKKLSGGGFWEDWYVSYKVDEETYDLSLVRDHDKKGNVNKVSFTLLRLHPRWTILSLQIERTETDFLRINWTHGQGAEAEPVPWTMTNRAVDASGDVVDTKVCLHRGRKKGDLIVLECKKRSADEEPNAATVAHYFANNRTESDVGFSVVSKVRVSNGKLDITVEGPEQHPASALLYMFDQVCRSGIWEPTMCPHCDWFCML